MKTLKLLLIIILGMILMASSCEPEPIEVEEPCKCEIKGIKQISFDYGVTWSYNGLDGRTGLMFECSYDGIYTNQTYGDDGIYYRILWKCKD